MIVQVRAFVVYGPHPSNALRGWRLGKLFHTFELTKAVHQYRLERRGSALPSLQEVAGNVKNKLKSVDCSRWNSSMREVTSRIGLSDSDRNCIQQVVHDARWQFRFAELKDFNEKLGHCNVPYRYPSNPALGKWVSKQRVLNNKVSNRLL